MTDLFDRHAVIDVDTQFVSVESGVGQLPDEVVAKVLHDNAAALYGL